MKYFFLLPIVILMASCSLFTVAGSKNYSRAIEGLDHNSDKEHLVLVKQKDFSGKKIFGKTKDTVSLRYSKNLFGIRDTFQKKIFVFKFFKDGTYTRYECDTTWRIQIVTEHMGFIY